MVSKPFKILLKIPVPWVYVLTYRFLRNPMYVSLILAYLGEAGFLVHVWPVIFLPLTIAYINLIVIPVEEAQLTEDFRDEYINYCKTVHRWL